MNLDPRFGQFHVPGLLNGIGFSGGLPTFGNGTRVYPDPGFVRPDSLLSGNVVLDSSEDDWQEDSDFSDEVLRYINQILMEEDVVDKGCMLQESLELQAAEKSLYDAIGERYPQSDLASDVNPSFVHQDVHDPYHGFDENFHYGHQGNGGVVGDDNGLWVDPSWADGRCFDVYGDHESALDYQTSQSSYSGPNSSNSGYDGFVESPVSILPNPGLYSGLNLASLFIQASEDASKFLPNGNHLVFTTENHGLPEGWQEQFHEPGVKPEDEDQKDLSSVRSRGRKHSFPDSLELEEERSSKQAAIYHESTIRSDMFDSILLCHGKGEKSAYINLREALQNPANKKKQQNTPSKGPSGAGGGAKGRGRKPNTKKEVVDLRTILLNCAQAAAADDRRMAYELLQKIRQHSSAFGDGNQRLAHCLADGLEARLAGTGSQIYRALVSKRTSAADVLKAYLLYLAACPFRKFSNFFSNWTIGKLTKNASRIHIIDFGILYGFQWPSFIQRQAKRSDGAPKVRITGIDFPQPGFRPAERVEETGRRLSNYAQEFKVPFEYNAIAKKWETIQLEDLKLEKGEVLIVNCIYRMKNLPDETMVAESARNRVLNLIRKINPDIFIHGVVSGAYNAPFFVTRFREALFHFSSHFDMLETIVPREWNERMLIERELLGREALNVVACEGWERVERPETYKQWQVRNLKAGFRQFPLDPEIKNRFKERVRLNYHKDFMIDDDSQWLLQGWKGRTIYALSTWKPA